MWYYLKKYPLSLLIVAAVLYLSFFKPPTMEAAHFPGFDKLAHICMYAGLSGMLWFEFFRNHRLQRAAWHGWIGAVLCPVLLSGLIELLQAYATTYRSGDWLDFLANCTGVGLATVLARYVLRPLLIK